MLANFYRRNKRECGHWEELNKGSYIAEKSEAFSKRKDVAESRTWVDEEDRYLYEENKIGGGDWVTNHLFMWRATGRPIFHR